MPQDSEAEQANPAGSAKPVTENTVPLSVKIDRGRQWVRGVAPYIGKTITLQRPISNAILRRKTRCPGVDEYFPLTINEHKQWLRIRGHSADNPVVIYLHGGPGGSQIPSYRYYQLIWESRLTMVHWEQRGAGKSFSASLDPKTMNLPQLLSDAEAVVDYVHDRFPHCPILLLGHSWGSMLGVHLLSSDATLPGVVGYVGMGQVGDQPLAERQMFEYTKDQAERDGHQSALRALSITDYPQRNPSLYKQVAQVRRWAAYYNYLGATPDDGARTYKRLMETPEYSVNDIYSFLRGTLLSSATLGAQMMTDDSIQPNSLTIRSQIPVRLISGRRDHYTPMHLSERLFDQLRAPDKRHIVFDESGHYPNEDEPERFLAQLLDLVS